MSLSWTEYLEGWALRSSRRWSAEYQHLRHPLSVELERDLLAGDLPWPVVSRWSLRSRHETGRTHGGGGPRSRVTKRTVWRRPRRSRGQNDPWVNIWTCSTEFCLWGMESVPCVTWNGLWVAEKGLETLSPVLGVGSASGGTENGPCDYTNASRKAILVDSNRMEMWRWLCGGESPSHVCPMQQWCLRDRPSRGGMAMGRGPGAEDWGGGRRCSLKRSYVALRCGPVPLRHCGSRRGMRWCCGTAGMDDDHWRNGVIWMGKDACCGRSPVGGLPTTSKGPLEEATGPVAVIGGDNKWYTDCMTAWLAAATAWVPDEGGGNPEAGDVTVDVGVVDSLPTMLSGLVIEPEGLWEGGNGAEGKFIEAVSATSLPGQSQGDGGSMYLCLDRHILAPGGADDVRKRRVRPKHGPGSGIRPGWGLVYCADPHWVWTRISARPSRATTLRR